VRILINDFDSEKDNYAKIFSSFGYEKNELILCKTFAESKTFIIDYLEKKKHHIDLIITNDSSEQPGNVLDASKLCFFKNSLTTSYSKNNFRICSIPIVLYSRFDSKTSKEVRSFDSIIQKNEYGNHEYFITECERLIKEWRKCLFNDIEVLGIKTTGLNDFKNTNYYKKYYLSKISANAETYFTLKTKVLSLEYIKYPVPLNYDWIILSQDKIAKAIEDFNRTYRTHVKYDRKNNERTILHDFFNRNQLILLRDVYYDLEYEKNLYDNNDTTSEECDFILKTEFPEFLKTTFFEVKKEDVTFYVKKHTKRPQFSSEFFSHLKQVWRYKEYAEDIINQPEIEGKIGYKTENFDYVLLAGRLDEKMEMKEMFDKEVGRMFNQISVLTYEELEEINIDYFDKFNRLSID
jgi:hypothetical protein